MSASYRETARRRERECRAEAAALEKRLRFFSKTNLITVLVPSLVAVCAGSVLFADDEWRWVLAVGALVGALLTAIHRGLDCDAYQAECERLTRAYAGLAIRYRTLHETDDAGGPAKLVQLDESLALVVDEAGIRVSIHAPAVSGGDGGGTNSQEQDRRPDP